MLVVLDYDEVFTMKRTIGELSEQVRSNQSYARTLESQNQALRSEIEKLKAIQLKKEDIKK